MTLPKPLALSLLLAFVPRPLPAQNSAQPAPAVFGYRDFSAQAKIEEKFLAVPGRQAGRRGI